MTTNDLFLFKSEAELEPRESASHASDPADPADPADRSQLTLQDVVVLKVSLSWQEAVAIVLEALEGLPAGSGCPDPACIALLRTGETRILAGTSLSGPGVRRAAVFLKRLMASAIAPAELRAMLGRDSSEQPEHTSIAEFVRALTYFQRPNRRVDSAAVYARAHAIELESVANQELERLRAKTAGQWEPARQTRVRFLDLLSPRVLHAAFVIGLWTLITASTIALFSIAFAPSTQASLENAVPRTPELSTPPRAPAPARVEEHPIEVSPARKAASSARGSPSSSLRAVTPGRGRLSAGRMPGPELPRQPPSVRAGATSSTSRAPLIPTEYMTVTVRVGKDDSTLADLAREARAAARPQQAEESQSLFSSADSDVEPPALVRPQLSSKLPDESEPLSEFELVISPTGQVEQVRLISPANRLNDRMLIAAAKAWQFQPAMKDGQPVRYRYNIRIVP